MTDTRSIAVPISETLPQKHLLSLAKSRRSTFTSADFFAGAGGLSVGFEAAGFRSIFFNEYNEVAAETYMANFPRSRPFVEPIQELTFEQIRNELGDAIEDLDIILGGPPCQGFSINAPVRRENDPRNHLFRHYIRILEDLRPKIILMENVPGLLSLGKGSALSDVVAAFRNVGYHVIFKVLNAAHYGVPEERWRLFFIGTRLPELELSFPEPICYNLRRPNFGGGRIHTFSHAVGKPRHPQLFDSGLLPPTTVSEAIDDLPAVESGGGVTGVPYQSEPETTYQKQMREGSKNIHNHECLGLAKINLRRMQHVKPGGSWRDIPYDLLPAGLQRARRSDHTRRYGRLDPNCLSGTVLTKCDPHWGTFIHYDQDRVITVREAARIQSFPDWFRFTGAKVNQDRQVGNAVPPL